MSALAPLTAWSLPAHPGADLGRSPEGSRSAHRRHVLGFDAIKDALFAGMTRRVTGSRALLRQAVDVLVHALPGPFGNTAMDLHVSVWTARVREGECDAPIRHGTSVLMPAGHGVDQHMLPIVLAPDRCGRGADRRPSASQDSRTRSSEGGARAAPGSRWPSRFSRISAVAGMRGPVSGADRCRRCVNYCRCLRVAQCSATISSLGSGSLSASRLFVPILLEVGQRQSALAAPLVPDFVASPRNPAMPHELQGAPTACQGAINYK
jgi:hypothetical protein